MTYDYAPGQRDSEIPERGWDIEPQKWTITIPAAVQFINLNQRMHWAQKAKLTRTWRALANIEARLAKLPKGLTRVHIVAHITKPTNRQYDVHNLMPTLKACLDGLVDYGLIPDDTNAHLTGPDLRQGGKGDAGVTITITELNADGPITRGDVA